MTKEQIEQWIAANGGAEAVSASSNQKTVQNPVATDYNRDDYDPSEPRQITVEVITWKNPRTGASLSATRMPGEQYEDITTVPGRTAETSTTRHAVEQHTDEDGTEWTQWSDGSWTMSPLSDRCPKRTCQHWPRAPRLWMAPLN